MWTTLGMAESATEAIAFSKPPESGSVLPADDPVETHELTRDTRHKDAVAANTARTIGFTHPPAFENESTCWRRFLQDFPCAPSETRSARPRGPEEGFADGEALTTACALTFQ